MRIGAGGLLIRGNTVLLAKRANDRALYPGVWDIVGGHCEGNETPAETLAREVEEEVGVRPTESRHIAVLEETNPSGHGEAQYHVFVVTRWSGGEPRLRGAEHSELRWLSLDEALSLTLAHPEYPRLIEAVLGEGSGTREGGSGSR